MNKRRNKSVTKTKHRVQKTKRSRRLNNNRSVKGIRGSNKTKVVGKRRNTVQRGGEVTDLVGRIYQLDTLTEQQRDESITTIINEINAFTLEGQSPQDLFEVALGQGQSPDERVRNGSTVLYAACRLKNPSILLVKAITEVINKTVNEFNVTDDTKKFPYDIKQNGLSNSSNPMHGAVQALKEVLEHPTQDPNTKITKIANISKILGLLNECDDNIRKKKIHINEANPKFNLKHTPLKDLPNKLSDKSSYMPYQEYIYNFDGQPSIKDLMLGNKINKDIIDTIESHLFRKDSGVHVPPPKLLPPTWFSRIYGFHEMMNLNTSNVRSSMSLVLKKINNRDHMCLRCSDGKSGTQIFDAGIPLYKSTGVLLSEAQQKISSKPPMGITYREIFADVKNLHANKSLAGSLFQVASQFNTLEMITPEHTPEMGITIYEQDRTQGPICAMACPSGTIYRNYFSISGHHPQTETNQINTLQTIIDKFKQPGYQVNFVIKNGYILPETIEDSNKLNGLLTNTLALEQMASDVMYAIQEDVPVLLNTSEDKQHSVSQIYCSGFPLNYSLTTTTLTGLLHPGEQAIIKSQGGVGWYAYMNRKLIKMITTAMYTATLSHAVNMTITQGKRVKVFLTLVGTGVFGADENFVKGIMGDVIRKYRMFPIDLYLVKFQQGSDFPSVEPDPLNIDEVNPLIDYPGPIPV